MSLSVFVDTSAWIALINKSDAFHLKAKTIRDVLIEDKSQFFVTDYVVVEIANSLSRIPWRSGAIQLINSIYESENINVVEISKKIYAEAWKLYSDRADKEWSLTDCTSFIVMNRNGISEAFTNDCHFEQAGFNILLKE
jgi:predicted nucleic acid-binding protein